MLAEKLLQPLRRLRHSRCRFEILIEDRQRKIPQRDQRHLRARLARALRGEDREFLIVRIAAETAAKDEDAWCGHGPILCRHAPGEASFRTRGKR